MITSVVAWPWRPILHHPPVFRLLLRLRHQRVNPDLKLLVLSLHGPPLLDEARMNFVLQVIDLLGEVKLWSSGLNVVFLAEGDPAAGELGGLGEGVEEEHGSAVVGDVAADLVDGVVDGEDGEDGVGGDDGGLLEGVDGADVDVDGGEAVGLAVALETEGEAVEVGLAGDRAPFGELVEDPGEGEPDLADDGDEPERERVVGRGQDPEPEEEAEDQQPEDDHDPVRADQAGGDRDLPP